MTTVDITTGPAARPAMWDILMQTAFLMARRGTCSRAHVGTVIARDGRILASGYNGSPAGMPHCEHPPDEIPVPDGGNPPSCGMSVHAEANAIAFAARHGVALDGAELFTTLAPCKKCAQLIINAGIVRMTYAQTYRTDDGLTLLRAALVDVRRIHEGAQ